MKWTLSSIKVRSYRLEMTHICILKDEHKLLLYVVSVLCKQWQYATLMVLFLWVNLVAWTFSLSGLDTETELTKRTFELTRTVGTDGCGLKDWNKTKRARCTFLCTVLIEAGVCNCKKKVLWRHDRATGYIGSCSLMLRSKQVVCQEEQQPQLT